MTVRFTETRLPTGWTADQLGQAVMVGDYVLISFLTTPLFTGSSNDYVVFALNGADADRFDWLIEQDGRDPIVRPDAGPQISVDVDVMLRVSVTVVAGGAEYQLSLEHAVVEGHPTIRTFRLMPRTIADFPGLFVSEEFLGSVGGEPITTREVVEDLRDYVVEAANATGARGVPPQFLAAIAYKEALARPKERNWSRPWTAIVGAVPGLRQSVREIELEAAADEINDDPADWSGDHSLGVCQIFPATAVEALGLPAWQEEAPNDPAEAAALAHRKIDVFNLLRFPKSNIAIAGRILVNLKNRANRLPNHTPFDLAGDFKAIGVLATEYNRGATNSAFADAKPSDYGQRVQALFLSPFLFDFFALELSYGGYELRLQDSDGAPPTYAGRERTTANRDTLPAESESGFVRQLQQDLSTLGFGFVGQDGVFDRRTEWAVREFQIYARMPSVARYDPVAAGRYVERLSKVPNPVGYAGKVTGTLTPETRYAMTQWLHQQLRVPVVVEARIPATGAIVAENIWLHDEVQTTAPRMYVRDLSDAYEVPPAHANQDHVIGQYATTNSAATGTYEGPSVAAFHSWAEATMTPETVLGVPFTNLDPAQQSTYRVIRALAAVEMEGHFDSVQTYDRGILSSGICHWTLGLITRANAADPAAPVSDGELCALMAYLFRSDPDTFATAFARFGLFPDSDWGLDGRSLYIPNQRKYACWLMLDSGRDIPRLEPDANYLKTWHWFYRFVMAGRTIPGWRRAMWAMARVRLRDVLHTTWGLDPNFNESAGLRGSQIGDVFSSEKSAAMVYRIHVNVPAFVCSGGRAGSMIRRAVALASLSQKAIGTWTQADEDLLVGCLINAAQMQPHVLSQSALDTLILVRDWSQPAPIGALRANRGSLQLDAMDLPPQLF